MELAFKEALKAYKEDEVPIGCVIVKDDIVLARANNKKEKNNCAISHAEIECIKKACKKIDNWNLSGADIYVTLEPCIMCAGAIVNSRISNVYYATQDPKGGAFGSNVDVTKIKKLNHYPKIQYGLLKDESSKLLKNYFKEKRLPRK